MARFLNTKTIIIIIVLFVGVSIVSNMTSGSDNMLLTLLLTVPAVLVALTFHEWAHAFVAHKLGDDTAKEQGRITLNPLKHLDPLGTIFLLLAGFGWGKPVEIDPRNFNSKYSIAKCEAIVSLAGPIMNFIMAFLFIILFYILFPITNAFGGLAENTQAILISITLRTIVINIGLRSI